MLIIGQKEPIKNYINEGDKTVVPLKYFLIGYIKYLEENDIKNKVFELLEKVENVVKTTNFKYLRQLEEKEGFIENKIMGIQDNKNFFFNIK